MTALNILPPFQVFTDSDGTPLDAGYIYIGTANLPPQTNPITVYWDEALTIPAAQPIRTANGYPSRAGTPARLYVGSVYSILVADSKNVPVLSAPESFDYATVSQVQDSSLQYLTSVSGVNTIVASASVPPTAYVAGQTFRFVAPNTNSGAVTLNVNGLGAKAVTKFGLTALAAYDIIAGAVVTVTYDGTRFHLATPSAAVSQYMNTARILGRTTAFPGVVQELTVGTGLSLSAGSLSGATASDTVVGVVELATNAEAQAGTDTTRAVTPAAMRSGFNASGSAPVYACRAWVNFDGTLSTPITPRASGNVSSVTKAGAGDYTVNFTTAIADANYSVAGMARCQSVANNITITLFDAGPYSTTQVRVKTHGSTNITALDADIVNVQVFR